MTYSTTGVSHHDTQRGEIPNPPLSAENFSERFLSLRDVIAITSCGKTFIYSMMTKGQFPKSVPLGSSKKVVWLLSEVRQWMRERLQARDS